MTTSLRKRIHTLVRSQLDRYPGAWMVWCDAGGHWRTILQRVAVNKSTGEFTLVEVEEMLAGHAGGLKSRRDLQQRLDAGESFVLYVPVKADDLGWLWAHALRAECIYDRSLRGQLQEWDWRPNSLTMSDAEVAALALDKLSQDPGEWGGDALKPDADLLIRLLGGIAESTDETEVLANISIEAAGLPTLKSDEMALWRKKALAHLLVAEVHARAPGVVPEDHTLLPAVEKRVFALEVLRRWSDSVSLAKTLPQAVMAADAQTGLGAQLNLIPARSGPFTSQAAERAAFANTCRRLGQLSGHTLLDELASLEEPLAMHANSFWGQREARQTGAVAWQELRRLSKAARALLEAAPQQQWSNPGEAIAWYTGGGWQIDRAGEEITRTLDSNSPDLVGMIAPLRAAYRALWEESLIFWSEVWSNAKCPMPTTVAQTPGEWLKQQLESSKHPTAVLMLDALRYDIAATLAERINQQEDVERAQVVPAHAGFPTITAIGMALALPIASKHLLADLDEKGWSIHENGSGANLSIAEERRKWWKRYEPGVEFYTLKDLHDATVPKAGGKNKRIVIHDATIDDMGHDELDFQGSDLAVQRYMDAIEQLRNLEWKRILVVTDHGFIHWTSPNEKSVAHPISGAAWASRRALAYDLAAKLTGPQGLAQGGKWRVAFPSGATSFSAYGGMRYFHGGASLQEWMIPCMAIEWPVESRPVNVTIEPLPRILSARPRITLAVSGESLLPVDNIARTVEVVARKADNNAILFRSEKTSVRVEQDKIEVALVAVDEVVAERGTALRIELRDAHTEAVIDSIESSLGIELTGW